MDSPLKLTKISLAILMATGCFSATAEEKLPEVVVFGKAETTTTQADIKQAELAIKEIPGGASLVDMDVVKQGRVSTWVDSLGLAPGVFVQERFGSEEARISIRGSALSRTYHGFGLKVMQDGIPINYADGFFDMQTVDPSAARYVEVLRGANASNYGSSTLGGAINFLSPTGYDSPRLIGRAEAGSFGYARLQAITGGIIKPQNDGDSIWDYNLSVNTMQQSGYRDHSAQDSQKAVANIGVKLSSNLESRFFMAAVRNRSQLPGYVTKAQLESDPTVANNSSWPNRFQRRDIDSQRLANKTVYTNGDYQVEVATYVMQHDLWHPITFGFIEQDTTTYGGHIKVSNKSKLFGANNVLTLGYLPDFGTTDGRTRRVGAGFVPGSVSTQYRQKSENHRFLIEDKFSLSDVTTLIGSLQYHQSNRKKEDAVVPASNYDIQYTQWIPRLGVIHNVSPSAQVFANVSNNFEPPIFDVTSTMLATKAQSGISYEVGTRGEAAINNGRDQLFYDLTFYRANLRNEFQTVCINGSTTCTVFGTSATVNVPKTVHQGIELGLSGFFNRQWEARGIFLYSDFRFDNNALYANNRMPGFPPVMLRGETLYRWGADKGARGLPASYAGPSFEWVPTAAPMDNTNSVSNDSYALLGFKAGGPIDPTWSWFLDARNLADKKYAATTNIGAGFGGNPGAAYYPGNGRSAYVGLEGKW
ncbi:MAG: TonB-dependent receptor [Oxalobacteraceae bacterium]|jgi:iron complex outermembrane receptor protein|nr:TonB-dependent receptor [Oxalobacteraceae bacterium]